jgi:hypothetical protein
MPSASLLCFEFYFAGECAAMMQTAMALLPGTPQDARYWNSPAAALSATKVRIGLVSGIVNTDMNNQY